MHLPRFLRRFSGLKQEISDQVSDPFGTVISFPKSGRTWLRVMLDRLQVPMCYHHDGSQYSLSTDYRQLSPCQGEYSGPRLVFLHRDPRDTVVSGFFQKSLRVKTGNYDGSLTTFLRDPCLGIEKIIVFNLAWLESGPSLALPFASLGYEALREAPLQGIKSLMVWLAPDRELDSERLESVVAASSFSAMRKLEQEGGFSKLYGSKLQPSDPSNPESFKVRRGVIGGYVDYFSPQDIDYADHLLTRYRYAERLASARANALL